MRRLAAHGRSRQLTGFPFPGYFLQSRGSGRCRFLWRRPARGWRSEIGWSVGLRTRPSRGAGVKRDTTRKLSRPGTVARYLLAPCLALATSSSAVADTISVSQREILKVFDMAAAYHHQKTVRRMVVDAACHFDPDVERSVGCAWFSHPEGADADGLREKVERTGKARCKQAGGGNCVLLWRNGTLRFDGLHPIQAERIESAVQSMATHDDEALPLPEGGIVPFGLQRRFEGVRDYWEKTRRERRGKIRTTSCVQTSEDPGLR